jgi:hypothetical protein
VREDCVIQGCLGAAELSALANESLETMVRRAVERIDATDGGVDAVLGFGGFPVAPIVSLLSEHYGVPGTPLRTIAACEHECWARLLETRCASSTVLPFEVFDAFGDVDLDDLGLDLPLWIRPVSGISSRCGIRITMREDFEPALSRLRAAMGRFMPAFEDLLTRVDPPAAIAGVGARHCIVEPFVVGRNCRVEAYASEGEVHSYGIADCVSHARESGLARCLYPSHLPFPLQDEIKATVARVGRALGLENATFTVDLVCDMASDRLWVTEVTTGPALENLTLFEMVDGTSGCAVAIDLALGRRPTYVHGRGRFGCAATFSLHAEGDAVVTRTPSVQELDQIRQSLPSTDVVVRAEIGDRLRRAAQHLSGDRELATVTIGGFDADALVQDYEVCKPMLHFDFSEPRTRWH